MSDKIIFKDLTVVIPTLGLRNLYNIIKSLNNTVKPHQIIISVYEKNFINVSEYLQYNNIKIIKNKIKGQVHQRINGFKDVQTKYVLQLDDDCEIDASSIKNLINFKKKIGVQSAIAPIYYDKSTNKLIHDFKVNYVLNLKFFLLNLFGVTKSSNKIMGTVSKIGTNYGVDPNFMQNNFLKCDWLPGGCILHNTSNLILKNYYPFKGKAIGEDLLHSYYLKKKNIELFVIKDSVCFTINDQNIENKIRKEYIIFLNYYNKLLKNNFYIYFLFYKIFFYLRRFFLNDYRY